MFTYISLRISFSGKDFGYISIGKMHVLLLILEFIMGWFPSYFKK